MEKSLTLAKKLLLEPASLDDSVLQKVLDSICSQKVDYADLYFQQSIHESWYLEDSEVKTGNYSIDKGVGVRAVSGEKTGFAYTDDVYLPAIEKAASAAKSIAKQGQNQIEKIRSTNYIKPLYQAINPIEKISNQDKIQLLENIDKYARSLDSRVVQVNASLSGLYEVVLILNAKGELTADVRPLISSNVSVVVEHKGRRESARSGGGGRVDYQYLLDEDRALSFAKDAVEEAVTNLDAEDSPAGTMPVVLGPGWPGVLLHEAVGHGLEGDFNRKGTSTFSGRIGQQVAAKGVTVVDDGTIENRRGSLSIDDEGTPSQNTVLIEDGRLVNYMQDKLNARLMGMESTGNCRRESYAHIPMPRMTNTYMLAGNYSPQEIIKTVKKGIYATNFGGGSVDITSGKFVFSASRAYLIEDGKVTRPVKGATLIGNGPEVMQRVSMIGNDLSLDAGIGVCGKEGQSVPVGVGQPTLKIDALTVGGTKV
jgi:TldD protein